MLKIKKLTNIVRLLPYGDGIVLFDTVELWSRKGAWNHLKEWVFSVDSNCTQKCSIVELGWFGVTILRNGCQG